MHISYMEEKPRETITMDKVDKPCRVNKNAKDDVWLLIKDLTDRFNVWNMLLSLE